jgi:hypothetical protein
MGSRVMDISEKPAGRFRRKNSAEGKYDEVSAAQLTWSTWGEVCEVLDLADSPNYGVWVNPETGSYAKEQETDKYTDIGVVFPSDLMSYLVRQDTWIVKDSEGLISFYPDEQFKFLYEKVEHAE